MGIREFMEQSPLAAIFLRIKDTYQQIIFTGLQLSTLNKQLQFVEPSVFMRLNKFDPACAAEDFGILQ